MNKLTLVCLSELYITVNIDILIWNIHHCDTRLHPNITLITVLIILFATANNEGGIIILITDSG